MNTTLSPIEAVEPQLFKNAIVSYLRVSPDGEIRDINVPINQSSKPDCELYAGSVDTIKRIKLNEENDFVAYLSNDAAYDDVYFTAKQLDAYELLMIVVKLDG